MGKGAAGFTLGELMMTLAVAAVVVAIGAPSFREFQRNNRLTAAANDFLTSLQLARTEAIKRQRTVAVCASSAPGSPAAVCNAGDFRGWIVFEDRDGNCQRAANEPLTGTGGPLDPAIANAADGACAAFSPTGFAVAVGGVPRLTRILFCDERGLQNQAGTALSAARGIAIANTGRGQIVRDPVAIGSWELECDAES
ncbi:MAG: GspH/FimT family pseudopilin [Steroidobacteraceae bacterium]|nr:GspH/FimT family pseudopilin [Steroidobacteraceae bacterium]MDW8259551.1 GspH/FimT family pseudopilin [Gammaproteobacteria bacterium]